MGGEGMRCAVKYCGGCKPTFDRVAYVRDLERRLGTPLRGADPAEEYDVLYVICGCTARCADYAGYRTRQLVLVDGTGPEFSAG